jgi:hypothetical protein
VVLVSLFASAREYCLLLLLFLSPAGPKGRASSAELVAAAEALLSRLAAANYLCNYQIDWGGLPGGWSADWAQQQQGLVMVGEAAEGTTPGNEAAAGKSFQVRVREGLQGRAGQAVVGSGGEMRPCGGV